MVAFETGTVYGIEGKMIDPEISREASEYMIDHYDEMVRQARKMGICEEKSFDIVHDVFISVVNDENNGEGYDINMGRNGDTILVNQFVYGRLKLYSKNKRYYATPSEEVCSSTSSDDLDSLDNFQKAYAVAGECDDIDYIEDSLSIAEEIEYCIGFEGVVDISIRSLLKNLHILRDPNIDKSLFKSLSDAISFHNEFGEALKHIMTYALQHKEEFNTLIANI